MKSKSTPQIQKTGHHRKKKRQQGKFVVQDEYFLKAKQLGYRARSVFKLLEIQERFGIIQPHFHVLDVGAAPGSFLQAIAKMVESDKIVIGVDLQAIQSLGYPNVKTIVCDVFEFELLKKEIENFLPKGVLFDVITSDIAPKTTGRFDVDQYASVELNIAICELSDVFLKPGGNMILKVFQGEDFHLLTTEVKKRFHHLKTYKPLACRDSSREEYIICLDKKTG